MTANIFVLGLDEHNYKTLQNLPDADQYRFHPLLTIEELQYGDEIPLRALLEKAQTQLEMFDGKIDAIVGFWDFPVSTMVPILCRRVGRMYCIDLASVVKCEHKYWSRLEQQKVTTALPSFGIVDPAQDTQPPAGVKYPLWVKPIKSFSSALAFSASNQEEFQDALIRIREGIGFVGKPFEVLLEHLDLPSEIAGVGGEMCLAEEAMTGIQVTLEGYRHHGGTAIYGIVDSVFREDISSFSRFQYPSSLPAHVGDRMADVSQRVLDQIGLDNSTFNIEFFWDRKRDVVNILEVNPRQSQSHAELFELVDGVANHQAMLDLALGHDPDMPHRKGAYPMAAKWFLRHFTDGIARRVPTEEEVAAVQRDIPGVTIDLIVAEGDRLSELPDQDPYSYKIANLYLGGADEDELKDKSERVSRALPFQFAD